MMQVTLTAGGTVMEKNAFLPASRARLSTAPDRPIFSLPAKSTKYNFPIFNSSSPSNIVSRTHLPFMLKEYSKNDNICVSQRHCHTLRSSNSGKRWASSGPVNRSNNSSLYSSTNDTQYGKSFENKYFTQKLCSYNPLKLLLKSGQRLHRKHPFVWMMGRKPKKKFEYQKSKKKFGASGLIYFAKIYRTSMNSNWYFSWLAD
uniref:Uncharacterized protein n=1 Tax=Romanomermis culicivorax TaxID=13658 RepID=A0A915J0H8_ROMCU